MGKDELKQLSKNDLVRLILSMQERLAALERRVARGRKDSSTSSKPPSSDIVKPPKPKPKCGKKRKIGAQPGHKKHEQKPIPPEDVDAHYEYILPSCPCCEGPLKNSSRPPRIKQQVDLVDRSVRVIGHEARASWCPCCRVGGTSRPAQ